MLTEPAGTLTLYNFLSKTFSDGIFYFIRSYNLKPVVTEIYPNTQESASYAVAVVKSNSGINRLEDLRDKRSCHTGFGRTAGKLLLYVTS